MMCMGCICRCLCRLDGCWKWTLEVEVENGKGSWMWMWSEVVERTREEVDQWRCYIQAWPARVRRDTSDSGILGNYMIRDGITRCEIRSQNAAMGRE